MDDLFDFAEIHDTEFFHEDTITDTGSNNTLYNKTQERCPNNLKITHYKSSVINLNQSISPVKK